MINVKICPNCGSKNVDMVAGGMTGQWACRDCGYIGTIFEKEIIQRTQGSLSSKLSRSKKKFTVGKEQRTKEKKK